MDHSMVTVFTRVAAIAGVVWACASLAAPEPAVPPVGEDVVFAERDGVLAAEAEHFFRQSHTEVRGWYLTTPENTPAVMPDGDPNHAASASGGAYLEALPDTRRKSADKLIRGENFSDEPGKLGILYYKVHISNPGTYYVWARIFSTNTEDNGLHVGIDGQWPASGQRMQWTAKQQWAWGSKQRTAANHNGEPHKLFLDIAEPGDHVIMFSMREDGTEFDKWMLIREKRAAIPGPGPDPVLHSGVLPEPFAVPTPDRAPDPPPAAEAAPEGAGIIPATRFATAGTNFYVDKGKWLAINPQQHKEATVRMPFPFADGTYDVTLHAVGENDGSSRYRVSQEGIALPDFETPVSTEMYEEGAAYTHTWRNVTLQKGTPLGVTASIGSVDGVEFSRGRWAKLVFTRADGNPTGLGEFLAAAVGEPVAPAPGPALHGPRGPNGTGAVTVRGELKQWHKVVLDIDGPYAHELDNQPNPFTDFRLTIRFSHADGGRTYDVPGFFAADGDAGNTAAESGTTWRTIFRPDRPGAWTYRVSFVTGPAVATGGNADGTPVPGIDGKTGTFTAGDSDKTVPDLRARGRLEYAGTRYLRFAGTGEFFLKQGADAPENLLAYADFDGGFKTDGVKDELVKTWEPHERDWQPGDPTWAGGRGKGLIGAMNYLGSKGMNAVSMLTLNIGGDDRNVFPYPASDDPDHMDCSKLAQWETVFDHAERRGLFLHFKTQETENECLLDNGDTGPRRSLYYRELIARFGHHLALNWNLGEENGAWARKADKQSTAQRIAMARYFADNDPYRGHIVIHNGQWPDDLLGDASALTGFSLQTNNPAFINVHPRTLDWVRKSAAAGKPWVVACDEPGDASHALLPDAEDPDHDNARMNGLWGCLLAGGAGNEWYFGYRHAHSDLTCQDWRSRDLWWDQCRHALSFFADNDIPVHEMDNANALVGNAKNSNTTYCFAKPGDLYLVYVREGTIPELDLTGVEGTFSVRWFNPRAGGGLREGSVPEAEGGGRAALGTPPEDAARDWLAVVRRR